MLVDANPGGKKGLLAPPVSQVLLPWLLSVEMTQECEALPTASALAGSRLLSVSDPVAMKVSSVCEAQSWSCWPFPLPSARCTPLCSAELPCAL